MAKVWQTYGPKDLYQWISYIYYSIIVNLVVPTCARVLKTPEETIRRFCLNINLEIQFSNNDVEQRDLENERTRRTLEHYRRQIKHKRRRNKHKR